MNFIDYLREDKNNKIRAELQSIIESDQEVQDFAKNNKMSEVLDFVYDKYFKQINETEKKYSIDADHLGRLLMQII